MKIGSRSNARPLFLLLMLALSLGGVGLVAVVSPDALPGWLRTLRPGMTAGSEGSEEASPGSPASREQDGASASPRGAADDLANQDGFTGNPAALPKGLTSIDGEGGSGWERAVKKNGVWFPVYSPGSRPGAGTPSLTVIPLSIASGNPPPARVNQPFSYQAEALGGSPPYAWTATLAAAGLEVSEGKVSGILTKPALIPWTLEVSDAAGARDSARLILTVLPERDLTLDTTSLPAAPPGESVTSTLTATGGVPPLRWSTAAALPPGWTLDPASGILTAFTENTGEWPVTFTVTDALESKATRELILTCRNSLEITTGRALPPAAPEAAYRIAFEAMGGLPPYDWKLLDGAFPGLDGKLSGDGVLTGGGASENLVTEFTLRVTDAEDNRYEKSFTMAVSDLLIVVPSREKAGVAWPTTSTAPLLARAGLSARGYRLLRDGAVIYEGTGNNLVDSPLPTGSTPRYTLEAILTDGTALPLAEKETAILPQTLTRARPGSTGDPFADRVVSFRPLTPAGYGSGSLPFNVTGPPDGRSVTAPAYKPGEVLSLHARTGAGGAIDLEFTDNIVTTGPGEDLTVFENVIFIGGQGNQRFMEPAVVSVGLFPGEWVALPCDVIPPAAGQPLDLRDPFYYASGIAGRNGTNREDPTNPARSGGDSLDLDAAAARAGLSWIRYIRIQSTGDLARQDDVGGDLIRHPDDPAFQPLSGAGSSGFDLDAVSAVHY